MEQQVAAGLGKGQVAELVEDEQVAPAQLVGGPALLVLSSPQPVRDTS